MDILANHNSNRLIAPELCPLITDGTSPAAEEIRRIIELLLSSRQIHFTACDRKLTFEFLDTTGSFPIDVPESWLGMSSRTPS
jgi:hypothetical protein